MNDNIKQLLLKFAPEVSSIPDKPEESNWGYQMSKNLVARAIERNELNYIPWEEVEDTLSLIEESEGAVELVKFNVYEGYLQGCIVLEWFTLETRRVGCNNPPIRTDYFC
jgi:hypothetical protein